jgi:virginiamycin B lyase
MPVRSAAALAMDKLYPRSVSPGSIPAGPMHYAKRVAVPQWVPGGISYSQFPGGASQVIITHGSQVWALSAGSGDHAIFRYWGGAWRQIPGGAVRISISPDGETLFAVNSAGGIFSYDIAAGTWTGIAGGASDIANTAGGALVVLSNIAAPDGNYAIWYSANGSWQQLAGSGVRIRASKDPHSYTFASDTFGPYGGCITNASGQIFCLFDTTQGIQNGTWFQIPGAASALALDNGAMMVAGFTGWPSQGAAGLYSYDWQGSPPSWSVLPGSGIELASNTAQLLVISGTNQIYATHLNTSPATGETSISPSSPHRLSIGSDGRVWFTDATNNQIGVIPTTLNLADLQTFPVTTTNPGLGSIASGPDGNEWFSEASANKIAKITPAGTITEFTVPTASSSPNSPFEGPDGSIWFTEVNGNKIAHVNTDLTNPVEIPIPTSNSQPYTATIGFDNAVWFTEYHGNKVGRVDPATNTVTAEYQLPSGGSGPYGITTGPDGNYWLTEYSSGKIAVMTPAGSFTEYPLAAGSKPVGIRVGPDGNLWFTEEGGNAIGSITTGGSITIYPAAAGSAPHSLANGPDGTLWFNEEANHEMGQLKFH